MKALEAFIKPFEAPQRSVKMQLSEMNGSLRVNCPKSFYNICLYETDLSDINKLVAGIFRTS